MKAIDAGYLGGHPHFRDEIEDGWLEVGEDGSVVYASVRRMNMMERRVEEFSIPAGDVRAVRVHSGTKIKRGGNLKAYAMGGVLTVAAHPKRVGSKNRPVDVVAVIDGEVRVLHFATEAAAGLQWATEVDAARLRAGLPPLGPEPQANSGSPFPSAPPPPAVPPSGGSVADEIQKLGELLGAGLLAQAEFNAQKAKLLS